MSERPYPPEIVKERLRVFIDANKDKTEMVYCGSLELPQFIAWQMEELFGDDPEKRMKRKSILFWLFGLRSVKELSISQMLALKKWLTNKDMAKWEARGILEKYVKEQGQLSFDETVNLLFGE